MRVTDILHMTEEELFRKQVMDQLVQKHIKQGQAAEKPGLTVRQVKRLKYDYERHGAKALLSEKHGRASNHRLKAPIKQTSGPVAAPAPRDSPTARPSGAPRRGGAN